MFQAVDYNSITCFFFNDNIKTNIVHTAGRHHLLECKFTKNIECHVSINNISHESYHRDEWNAWKKELFRFFFLRLSAYNSFKLHPMLRRMAQFCIIRNIILSLCTMRDGRYAYSIWCIK